MKEFLDPYDPAYLEDPVDKNPYRLPNWERVKCHKVGILQSYLRAAKVSYDWDDGFRVERQFNAYSDARYLYVSDDGEYCYGTAEQCLIASRKVSDVIRPLLKWLHK